MNKLAIAAVFLVALVGRAPVVDGGEVLRIHVSPVIAREPALLVVRVMLESPAGGRFLKVTAESQDFYRSSEIPIDGRNATPLKVFEFSNLPAGVYEVTGILVGERGQWAAVSQVARVVASVGGPR
jgi:hypothetical protein